MANYTIGSGKDYATLSSYIANVLDSNTMTEDDTLTVFGVIDTAAQFSNYTPDGFQITVQSDSAEGTAAFTTSDALAYNESMGGTLFNTTNAINNDLLGFNVAHTLNFIGLQLKKQAINIYTIDPVNGVVLNFRDCIIQGASTNVLYDGANNTSDVTLIGCLVHLLSSQYFTNKNQGTLTLINCTFVGAGTQNPVRMAGMTFNCYQSLFEGFNNIVDNVSGTLNGDYNILVNPGGSGTIPDDSSTGLNTTTSQIVTDLTDARLDTGVAAIGFIPSANKHADTPTTDIIGQTITGDVQCGCYFVTAGGGGGATIPVFWHHHRTMKAA